MIIDRTGAFSGSGFCAEALRALQTSYEKYKELAYVHAGPACIDGIWRRTPFFTR